MKKVLGLDLGTTSIGWALVNQAESGGEKSSIIRAGVRVNPLTVEEKDSFEKGKAITTNADRTLKRSARRNLQRYKLRREALISLLKSENWISDETLLSENGNGTTFETYRLRSSAVTEEITLEQLARVLLMINKKRGYKSSRKADSGEDGQLIDGMALAKQMYDQGLTPGQVLFDLLNKGKKFTPDFYRSDLQAEMELIWNRQCQYYPDILSESLWEQLKGKGRNDVSKILTKNGVNLAENKGAAKKYNALNWRVKSLSEQLPIEQIAYVLSDIAGAIAASSGYLGSISDRSKELYFNKQTVGQYLYKHISEDSHFSVRNKVFYRQDYLDEFNAIWEAQRHFHPELTEELKREIRDVVIFYQRRLKSQKGLISFCEFESREVEVEIEGKTKKKTRGCRVAPRSSLIFQEFKIWQILNNVVITSRTEPSRSLSLEEKELLAQRLGLLEKMKSSEALKLIGVRSKSFRMNFETLEGNVTASRIYSKFLEIMNIIEDRDVKIDNDAALDVLKESFERNGFNTALLTFDTSLPKEEYEKQALFKLWHLLYSFEGDNSTTGNAKLIEKIASLCSMPEEYASMIAAIRFQEDYASLSHKAIRKILPHLKKGLCYSDACAAAGYNHSNSETAEDRKSRKYLDKLDILPKNSLRNPVVEKILNQMINVVNTVAENYGKPDEIHIELARELKQNAKQRAAAVTRISDAEKDNERIRKILESDMNISHVSKNDILRYRLWEELEGNGYKSLYSNRYIPKEKIFSGEIDIEHIIPQAVLFDDSFANKTLEYRDINLQKGKMTAYDYVLNTFGENELEEFKKRVINLENYKNKPISRAKAAKLLTPGDKIPEDFVNRDLTCSQYIAKKSKEILEEYVQTVVPTSGAITARLREDWQLVDVMKELNWDKYEEAGLTYSYDKNDKTIRKIKDWTKRNDHRHHAMDAITIAFTTPAHIQYLNNLNAISNKESSIYGIETKYTELVGSHRVFRAPIQPVSAMRSEVRRELESILVSIKSKNKVATRNINKTKTKNGSNSKICLTPRGMLHKESIYGKRHSYETYDFAIGSKMTYQQALCIAKENERSLVLARLAEFGNNPKKAFSGKNSLDKNPIWMDAGKTVALPSKVKCVRLKDYYSIRKSLDSSLNIEKVVDGKIRALLQERLMEYGGSTKDAFANLEKEPIWFNREQGIMLKKVTIAENFEELIPLHDKRDHKGELIADQDGKSIPADYVNLRNNHHVAIYLDEDGNYQEVVVSLLEAVDRMTNGYPVVDTTFRKSEGWEFLFSMKINEMFVFPDEETGFNPADVDLMDKENYALISPHLYRVQSISTKDYYFRHHLETTTEKSLCLLGKTWKRIRNPNSLKGAIKVRINHIGEIVDVGEY